MIGMMGAMGFLVWSGRIQALPDLFNLGQDDSIAEIGNFVKWGVMVALLAFAAWRLREPVYAALSLGFLVLLADDSLQIHERVGGMLHPHVMALTGTGWNVATALAEQVYWAAVGSVLAILTVLAAMRSSPQARRILWPVTGLIFGLGVCGIVFDFFHHISGSQTLMAGLMTILEDGGEMLFISGLLVLFHARLAPAVTQASLPDRSAPADAAE